MATASDWLCSAIGALFAGVSAWEILRGARTLRWPETSGRVIDVGVRERQARGTRYLPTIRYRYDVGGSVFVASRVRFGLQLLYRAPGAAGRALGALPPGREVRVYYNPKKPSEAVLGRGVTILTLVFLVAGILFVALAARS